jgi:hypothetical protein
MAIDLDVWTLADWVGAAAATLTPLVDMKPAGEGTPGGSKQAYYES